ncbi:hypothetical protein DFH07DRAFT_855480 [Mycena maculata]|uniref:Uncharacterized protein n=1 Tax=Mycena maculata TaxID=230809 RepID=A0AAD7HNM4_9AGAR|nr:hypothetical protein DFH07DRAFT_855480 [Mycena maculata]
MSKLTIVPYIRIALLPAPVVRGQLPHWVPSGCLHGSVIFQTRESPTKPGSKLYTAVVRVQSGICAWHECKKAAKVHSYGVKEQIGVYTVASHEMKIWQTNFIAG